MRRVVWGTESGLGSICKPLVHPSFLSSNLFSLVYLLITTNTPTMFLGPRSSSLFPTGNTAAVTALPSASSVEAIDRDSRRHSRHDPVTEDVVKADGFSERTISRHTTGTHEAEQETSSPEAAAAPSLLMPLLSREPQLHENEDALADRIEDARNGVLAAPPAPPPSLSQWRSSSIIPSTSGVSLVSAISRLSVIPISESRGSLPDAASYAVEGRDNSEPDESASREATGDDRVASPGRKTRNDLPTAGGGVGSVRSGSARTRSGTPSLASVGSVFDLAVKDMEKPPGKVEGGVATGFAGGSNGMRERGHGLLRDESAWRSRYTEDDFERGHKGALHVGRSTEQVGDVLQDFPREASEAIFTTNKVGRNMAGEGDIDSVPEEESRWHDAGSPDSLRRQQAQHQPQHTDQSQSQAESLATSEYTINDHRAAGTTRLPPQGRDSRDNVPWLATPRGDISPGRDMGTLGGGLAGAMDWGMEEEALGEVQMAEDRKYSSGSSAAETQAGWVSSSKVVDLGEGVENAGGIISSTEAASAPAELAEEELSGPREEALLRRWKTRRSIGRRRDTKSRTDKGDSDSSERSSVSRGNLRGGTGPSASAGFPLSSTPASRESAEQGGLDASEGAWSGYHDRVGQEKVQDGKTLTPTAMIPSGYDSGIRRQISSETEDIRRREGPREEGDLEGRSAAHSAGHASAQDKDELGRRRRGGMRGYGRTTAQESSRRELLEAGEPRTFPGGLELTCTLDVVEGVAEGGPAIMEPKEVK